MELRQLRYFVAVAEELHFGIAAKKLNMTQPPLSHSIKLLEEEIGVKLLERGRRKPLTLTPSGQALLTSAKELLRASERAKAETQMVAKGELGSLKIAHTDDYLSSAIPEMIFNFAQSNSKVSVQVVQGRSFSIAQQLMRKDLDLIFTIKPIPAILAECGLIDLPATPIVLVVSEKNPLSRKKSITLKEAMKEHHLYNPSTNVSSYDTKLQELLVRSGTVMQTRIKSFFPSMALEFAKEDKGVFFASKGALPRNPSGLRLLPIDAEGAEIELAMVWKKDNSNPVLNNFLEMVAEHDF